MNRLSYHRFATYEAREEAFRRLAGGLIPRRYGGPALFWNDLRGALERQKQLPAAVKTVQITANPRDCLAFASARQVMTAAVMTVSGPGSTAERVKALAEAFSIGDLMGQPIRTLSGGETVKVALAKAAALRPAAGGLVVASPFAWLSRDNHLHLRGCVDRFARAGQEAKILLLEGEDDQRPVVPADLPPGPVFDLRLAGVRTALSPSLGVAGQPPVQAAVADTRVRLRSPCLVEGVNGQGKSLLAKILSRAVPFEGRAQIDAGNGAGEVRLLFQDVLTQALLRSDQAIAAAASCDPWRTAAALEDRWRRFRGQAPGGEPEFAAASLRSLKLMLTAVRLCSRPAALILDEPDWGLSRRDAIAFVQAVICVAHRQKTAVMLISHKAWWPTLGASTLTVRRRAATPEDGRDVLFRLVLQTPSARVDA